jgi:beta-glucuronidase
MKNARNAALACLLIVVGMAIFQERVPAQALALDQRPTSPSALAAFQPCMENVQARHCTSLNGKWQAIIDFYDFGIGGMSIWKDQRANDKTHFFEYSFDGGPKLVVPGDFNSQLPELKYYESTVWYKKTFDYRREGSKRVFLHFGAANYKADVFLNGVKLGSHEGGFTPFQFEVTDRIKEGKNALIVRVNSQRAKDQVPPLDFDWWNYGGLTRDVNLVQVPETFIEDYCVQLKRDSMDQVVGWIQLNGSRRSQDARVEIPEAGVDYRVKTDPNGRAAIAFPIHCKLWSPETPKLYKVKISCADDSVTDHIGFRSIQVKGTEILLNGKPIFLRGVDFHEEIPQRGNRAVSEADSRQLLGWAKALGCNFVRTAHYPQNERTVRLAESMGIMLWEEIPVFQNVAFGDPKVRAKMDVMLREEIDRDKNRCGIIIWSLSNETRPGTARDNALADLASLCRSLDSTRLVGSALNSAQYQGATVSIKDPLCKQLDVIGVNEYLGWYKPWPCAPEKVQWKSDFDKPAIMTEFGGEALAGNHGPADVASSWSEEYQEQLYKDQVAMFKTIPFLRGCCPWILADFRTPRRMLPKLQDGWNRKGLIGQDGEKKLAWNVMRAFYKELAAKNR